jgi:hypothetical protein
VLNALVTAAVVAFGAPWWVSGLIGLAILVVVVGAYYATARRGQVATKSGVSRVAQAPSSVRLVSGAPATIELTQLSEQRAAEAHAASGAQ